MRVIESAKIRDMQTLCISMGHIYVTVVYAGTVDLHKQFIWSTLEITEGGASLTSKLFTLIELKEHLNMWASDELDDFPAINDYLKNK